MRRAAAFVIGLLAVESALSGCCSGESYVCGPDRRVCVRESVEIVGRTVETFEDRDSGTRIVTPPGVTIGDSFHPGDRALHIAGGSTATMEYRLSGIGDGEAFQLAARCTSGTSLAIEMERSATGVTRSWVLSDIVDWTHSDWTLSPVIDHFDSLVGALSGGSYVRFRLEARGTGECVVDRVTSTRSALVCLEHQIQQTLCCRSPYFDATVPTQ